jgi:aminoglycoside phosphotransferase (APT) family kinase protein
MDSDSSSDDEYDSDEPAPLVLNFGELARRASIAVSRPCTRWRKLTKGRFHEIFVLFFNSDGASENGVKNGDVIGTEWSCIARISREPETFEKLRSEVETMQYVRSQTSIPVPEIYAYDFDLGNNVGAQFMLMERLPGRHLYQLWDKLTLDHKKAVLSDIVRLLAQFSQLKFDSIGCLRPGNMVGPLLYRMGDGKGGERTCTSGPFESTLDYLLFFLNAQTDKSEVFSEVEAILKSHMSVHKNSTSLCAPFRLIHADFDAQNLLFTGGISDNADNDNLPPRISGLIDWEYAYIGPLYFLYEYPIFIQDCDDNKAAYADNAILRPHFIRALRQCFSKDSTDRAEVDMSMKKNYTLNEFHTLFVTMAGGLPLHELKMLATRYVGEVEDGTGNPYSGRFDYLSDGEVLSDD